MTKQAFIIHGWDGYHDEGLFPWLEGELGEKGFQVMAKVAKSLDVSIEELIK